MSVERQYEVSSFPLRFGETKMPPGANHFKGFYGMSLHLKFSVLNN